jgi:hypothetical protein
MDIIPATCPQSKGRGAGKPEAGDRPGERETGQKNGAGNGTRTHNTRLGKPVLYH